MGVKSGFYQSEHNAFTGVLQRRQLFEGTHLEHGVDAVELGLQQVSPGGQVAVGQDAAGLQQPVGVGLNTRETHPVQSNHRRRRCVKPDWPIMVKLNDPC